MTLSPGVRLGPYEIVAPIGAGGMGEVYRASDTRLERQVAIKVLSPELSSNAQLRARFEREARAISALTHPNICTLYDVGRHDEIDYLVMEYLEGEPLIDRIARGPMPLEDVLRVGMDVAAAKPRDPITTHRWPLALPGGSGSSTRPRITTTRRRRMPRCICCRSMARPITS